MAIDGDVEFVSDNRRGDSWYFRFNVCRNYCCRILVSTCLLESRKPKRATKKEDGNI